MIQSMYTMFLLLYFGLLLIWEILLYLFSEEEQFTPLDVKKDQPISKWDDEDVDENDVKDSWEDFDEPAPVWRTNE